MAITPTFSLAEELVRSGADIIAVDVRRTRPFGEPLAELLPRIRRELGVPVMADCATVEDARAAVEIGVDLVASTFGFRQNGLGTEPDFQLLRDMLQLGVPVVAEVVSGTRNRWLRPWSWASGLWWWAVPSPDP